MADVEAVLHKAMAAEIPQSSRHRIYQRLQNNDGLSKH